MKTVKNKRSKFKRKYKNTKHKLGGTKKHTKKINCSPKPKGKMNRYTCYTNDDLIKLKEHWNARHLDNKIDTNIPKEIHQQLKQRLKNVCNNEACWLKQKTIFGKIAHEVSDSFAPESPAEWKTNPNEWLSSTDIIKVMKQYEAAYKCFDFIGPTPINFNTRKLYGECVWNELCNLNLETHIKNGISKIGIIFNTDPDYKPGQHWISMFINLKEATVFFFDSTGDPPPKEVVELIDKIKHQGKRLTPKIDFKIDSNQGVEHQYGNTECGMYCLYFIVHMLEDKVTEHYMKTHILKDEYIEGFRHIFFNEASTL